MTNFSQGREQNIILRYFEGRKIKFLSIGENDGETLSNVRALALNGNFGLVVEPAPIAFSKLKELYQHEPLIFCLNVAIGAKNGKGLMFDSGSHIGNGDTSLLSTLNQDDYEKWKGVAEFNKVEVEVMDVQTMLQVSPYARFECISIDCEGNDLIVLKQLNLSELGCELLCIEWNSDKLLKEEIINYCGLHGMNYLLLQNAENLIISRNKIKKPLGHCKTC